MKPRAHRVIISDHAYEQYVKRMDILDMTPLSRAQLERKVFGRFNDRIGLGAKIDKTNAVRLEVHLSMDAVLELGKGAWAVKTFLFWDEELYQVECGA